MKYVYLLLCLTGCVMSTKNFAQAPADSTAREVLTIAEEMPEFPGGEAELYDFIGKNLSYPAAARENAIQGKVLVKFVVEKDGYIDKIEIIKKLGWGCDEEVMRVIRSMPKWKPGKMKGNPVAVYFMLPVIFKLK